MDSLPVAGFVGTAVYDSCLPIRERQRQRHQGAAVFAALVMFLGMLAAVVAGIHSTGCASQEEADAAAAVATQRIDELKAAEAAADARHDQAAADEARLIRGRIEAALAQVRGAAAAKPSAAEPAAQGLAAALLPGGVGAAIAGGLGLVGHLMRSRNLAQAIAKLRNALDDETDAHDNTIDSIEAAKYNDPDFNAAFKKAAPIIARVQRASTTRRVRKRYPQSASLPTVPRPTMAATPPAPPAPTSSAPAASA